MTWQDYVNDALGSEHGAQSRIAKKSGVQQADISRWSAGKLQPTTPAPVAAFALATGRNVLEAFVAAGFLTPQQAGMPPEAPVDLSVVDSAELADEVKRRLTAPVGVVSGRQVRRSGSKPPQSSGSEPPQPTGSLGAGGRRRG